MINKFELSNVFRELHPKMVECLNFSRARATFTKIAKFYNAYLDKFQRTEILYMELREK